MGYKFTHQSSTSSEEIVIKHFKPGDTIGAFFNIWNVVSSTPKHLVAELLTENVDGVMTITQYQNDNFLMHRSLMDLNSQEVQYLDDANALDQISMPNDITFKKFLITDTGLAIERTETTVTPIVVELVQGDQVNGVIDGVDVVGVISGVTDDTLWLYVDSTKTMYKTDPEQVAELNITSFVPAIVTDPETPVFAPTDSIFVENTDPDPAGE